MSKIATVQEVGEKTGNGDVSALLGPSNSCPTKFLLDSYASILNYRVNGTYVSEQLVQLEDIEKYIPKPQNQTVNTSGYYFNTNGPMVGISPSYYEITTDYGYTSETHTYYSPYATTTFNELLFDASHLKNASKLIFKITFIYNQKPNGWGWPSGTAFYNNSSLMRISNIAGAGSYEKKFPAVDWTAPMAQPQSSSVDFTVEKDEIYQWLTLGGMDYTTTQLILKFED